MEKSGGEANDWVYYTYAGIMQCKIPTAIYAERGSDPVPNR